jgi:hypothetical protein
MSLFVLSCRDPIHTYPDLCLAKRVVPHCVGGRKGGPSIRPRTQCILFSFSSATYLPSFHLRIEPPSPGHLLPQAVPSASARLASSQFRREPMHACARSTKHEPRSMARPFLTSNTHPASTARLRSAVPPPRQSQIDQARTAHQASAAY